MADTAVHLVIFTTCPLPKPDNPDYTAPIAHRTTSPENAIGRVAESIRACNLATSPPETSGIGRVELVYLLLEYWPERRRTNDCSDPLFLQQLKACVFRTYLYIVMAISH
jgi:hypothetical protein